MKGIQSFLEQIENSGIEIKKPTHLGYDYFKKAINNPYLNNLIKNIESRFDDKSMMAAFDLYNLSKLTHLPKNPSTEDIEICLEYDDNVEKLTIHFQGIVADSIECIEE